MSLPPELQVFRDFLIALLIGALVGIEREKRKIESREVAFGGLRTFILFAEAGALSAWLSVRLSMPWLFVLTVVVVAVAVIVAYVFESRANPDSLGLTTEVAAICVCLLGGAVMYGHAEVAVALAIVTASVLAFKQPLHGIVEKLGMDDIYAALKLLIATFIVLPVLPDRTVDPWGALNPYKLWSLVILISGLSLVGYVAARWLGSERGALVTGLTGGLASSTAVSVSFARQSAEGKPASGVDSLAAGILVAWSVMFVRIVVALIVVHAALAARIWPACAAMAVVAAGAALILVRSGGPGRQRGSSEVPLTNPFSLWAAIQFGAMFAAVLLVVKIVQASFADSGLYVVAALAGLVDVDAITLSVAEYARHGGSVDSAALAVVIAALSNTAAKYGIVAALGAKTLRTRMLPVTVALVVVGIGAMIAAAVFG